MNRICKKCNINKDIIYFPLDYQDKFIYIKYTCKECFNEYHDKWSTSNPWYKTRKQIQQRLRKEHPSRKYYYNRGIKNFLSSKDLKSMWFRDKAYLMKRPSIDRIDPFNHYCFSNCRYIELSENSRRANLKKERSKNESNGEQSK